MTTEQVLTHFPGARPNGKGWTARCPAHDDRIPSLTISQGKDGRTLLKCFGGCSTQDVVSAAGLTIPDLFIASSPSSTWPSQAPVAHGGNGQRPGAAIAAPPVPGEPKGAPVAIYHYRDTHGVEVLRKARYRTRDDGTKPFHWFHPDGQGNWLPGSNRVEPPLYRLDEIRARGSNELCIVEGEKDADRLWSLGLPATTAPHGSGSWRPEFAEQIKTAAVDTVIIFPDNDDPGRKYAADVAASCHAVGLKTKIVTLPDLPEHGDVSDYLDTHDAQSLMMLALQAPEWKATVGKAGFILTTLDDLLSRASAVVNWLWDRILAAGTLSDLVGKPKSGKSTFLRCLCLAVARGEPFLGRDTTQGVVWYIALEEREQDVKDHFKALGATGDEPIYFFIGQAPPDIIPRMHELAAKERPALIAIDPMQRFLKLKDISDYAEQSNKFDPVLAIARDTGAAVVFSHHAPKGEREDVEAGLGSIGIVGSVHTHLVMRRSEKYRTLSSVQRTGPDLEPTVLEMDPATKWITAGLTRTQADEAEAEAAVLGVLEAAGVPLVESDIRERASVRTGLVARALRVLRDRGQVARTGVGRKGDPYLYAIADSRSLVPGIGWERENENPKTAVDPHKTESNSRSGFLG